MDLDLFVIFQIRLFDFAQLSTHRWLDGFIVYPIGVQSSVRVADGSMVNEMIRLGNRPT
jgi:hypothetical protein